MKNLIVKSLFLVSILIFVDLLLMIIIGCTSCLFCLNENFYTDTYCVIGKIIFSASFVILAGIVFFNCKSFLLSSYKD